MASAPTHVVAAAAVATAFYQPKVPWHLWAVGAALAIAPDLDAIGFHLGVPYDHVLGHRGLSHSLLAASVVSVCVTRAMYWSGAGPLSPRGVWLFLFLAMASHGFLDALTDGGHGVAFWAPFVNERYFFPFRPLAVSPLSVNRFLSNRGLAILANEALWVWLPSVGVGGGLIWYRVSRRGSRSALPAVATNSDPRDHEQPR